MPVYEGQEPGESTTFTPVPEGIHEAELLAVEEKVMPWTDDDGKEVRKVQFSFVLRGGENDGRKVRGQTSNKFVNHTGCKLWSWSQELLGHELPSHFKLDTDHLIGQRARVMVMHKITKKKVGVDEGGAPVFEENTWAEVQDVLRSKNENAGGSNGWAEEPF